MKDIINDITKVGRIYGELPYRCHKHLIVNGSIIEGPLSNQRLNMLSDMMTKAKIVPDFIDHYKIGINNKCYDICGSYLLSNPPSDFLDVDEVPEVLTQEFENIEPTIEDDIPVKYYRKSRYLLNEGVWTKRRFSRNNLIELCTQSGFISSDFTKVSTKVLYEYAMYHHPNFLSLEIITCIPGKGYDLLSSIILSQQLINILK